LSGVSFYLGAIVVLLVTVFLGIFLGHQLTAAGHGDDTTMGAIDLFLGAVLLLLGLRNFASKEDNKGSNVIKHLQIDPKASSFNKFHQILYYWIYSIPHELQHRYLRPGRWP
jgi:hypothetical protein